MVIQGIRWWVLLKAFVPKLRMGEALLYHFRGAFYSIVLPSGAAQDILRAAMISRNIDYAIAWGATWLCKILGILVLSPQLGINGVAIAVDVMLFVGIIILFTEARKFVDYSLKDIFAIPALGLLIGSAAAIFSMMLVDLTVSSFWMMIYKAGIFSIIYLLIIIISEFQRIREIVDYIGKLTRN